MTHKRGTARLLDTWQQVGEVVSGLVVLSLSAQGAPLHQFTRNETHTRVRARAGRK
jgi:hypothetical protein